MAPKVVGAGAATATRAVRAVTAASSATPSSVTVSSSSRRAASRALTVTRAAADEEAYPNASVSASCSIDDPSSCSLADLEMMYVDALWSFYNGGSFSLSDEQYDRLREELNWQGSGFPTLRRYEVEFVQAAISFARGEPVVSDEEYESLKRKVKAAGKRDDVTALLLYTKGQQLLEQEQFDRLADEMKKLDIDVGLRGATCTLSNTSPDLTSVRKEGKTRRERERRTIGQRKTPRHALVCNSSHNRYRRAAPEPDQSAAGCFFLLFFFALLLNSSLSRGNAPCSYDPSLQDAGTLSKAYLAMSTIPVIIGFVPYIAAVLLGKTDVFPVTYGAGFAVAFGVVVTSAIVNYTGLQNGEVLVGQCPCCDSEIKQFFGGEEPAESVQYKCMVCGTESVLDRKERKITTAGGIKAV